VTEATASRRIMIPVFHHPDDVAGLVDRDLETASLQETCHVAE
jgi:hypothetical protein